MQRDSQTFRNIDRLFDSSTPTAAVIAALAASDWQIQQAACLALSHRPDPAAVETVMQLLDAQDRMDVYGAPDNWTLDGAADDTAREIWRCRFRVKQAACLALGSIGGRFGHGAVSPVALARLMHYATNDGDDYAVRAAACQALGLIRAPSARTALGKAAADGEWCTRTEAIKALNNC